MAVPSAVSRPMRTDRSPSRYDFCGPIGTMRRAVGWSAITIRVHGLLVAWRKVRTDAQTRLAVFYQAAEVVWQSSARMPIVKGIADVDVREAHEELRIVDPEGAVIDARTLKA